MNVYCHSALSMCQEPIAMGVKPEVQVGPAVEDEPTIAASSLSYEDKTEERTKDVWYTNASGEDLIVTVWSDVLAGNTNGEFRVRADDTSPIVAHWTNRVSDNVAYSQVVSVVVPAGHEYYMHYAQGARVVLHWVEGTRA